MRIATTKHGSYLKPVSVLPRLPDVFQLKVNSFKKKELTRERVGIAFARSSQTHIPPGDASLTCKSSLPATSY